MGNFSRGGDRPHGKPSFGRKPFGGGGSRFGGKPSFGGRPSFGGGRDGGRPMMHSATCSECGNDCQVPFKPTGERPVFCNTCFGKQQDSPGNARPNRFSSDRPRFNDDRRERPARLGAADPHTATCSKCGKECQVPFKPMPGKPVFCNDCFEKPGAKDAGELLRQVEALHAKFDKLMKILVPSTATVKAVEAEVKADTPAKKEKTKVASKKVTKKKKK
ncbi:MAG: hypothetical protein A3J93_00130 [Candidatus Magasanikbacteria bacterium RIFOXYC2_FULL_42_28]|uniref:CxxC-x17-CxxC domain-containing protein n=1 Tax=Candidatus Magasanikbacteria bacterium RIFOXYC2_FULL_42_28 TaxID=1798704 RepID=A0A1F6NW39_9BACT|nr:MAG: hypothetical protein A3J93_00130 [Candidatus Magasanikbacteria bacterium RIFOXYC2_FULL_42_28]